MTTVRKILIVPAFALEFQGRISGTHDLIRVLLWFRAAFLRLEDATRHFLRTTKECFFSQRPAGATVSAYAPQFPRPIARTRGPLRLFSASRDRLIGYMQSIRNSK